MIKVSSIYVAAAALTLSVSADAAAQGCNHRCNETTSCFAGGAICHFRDFPPFATHTNVDPSDDLFGGDCCEHYHCECEPADQVDFLALKQLLAKTPSELTLLKLLARMPQLVTYSREERIVRIIGCDSAVMAVYPIKTLRVAFAAMSSTRRLAALLGRSQLRYADLEKPTLHQFAEHRAY